MNRVCLIGRLTNKPELRQTNSNLALTRFTLAVNRNFSNSQGQREADFITIVAWRKQAENICRYLDKGSLISVEGRIQTGSFDGQDGQRRYTTEIIADQVNFLESRSQSQARSNNGYSSMEQPSFDNYNEPPVQNNVDIDNDPFASFGDSVSLDDNFLD